MSSSVNMFENAQNIGVDGNVSNIHGNYYQNDTYTHRDNSRNTRVDHYNERASYGGETVVFSGTFSGANSIVGGSGNAIYTGKSAAAAARASGHLQSTHYRGQGRRSYKNPRVEQYSDDEYNDYDYEYYDGGYDYHEGSGEWEEDKNGNRWSGGARGWSKMESKRAHMERRMDAAFGSRPPRDAYPPSSPQPPRRPGSTPASSYPEGRRSGSGQVRVERYEREIWEEDAGDRVRHSPRQEGRPPRRQARFEEHAEVEEYQHEDEQEQEQEQRRQSLKPLHLVDNLTSGKTSTSTSSNLSASASASVGASASASKTSTTTTTTSTSASGSRPARPQTPGSGSDADRRQEVEEKRDSRFGLGVRVSASVEGHLRFGRRKKAPKA
ncbi:hypothetical protein AX16_006170 [Volvariella volvacea WC 439]|nr:hypothetical protein AX16_006170 [Volvariella volvacea WC 439]